MSHHQDHDDDCDCEHHHPENPHHNENNPCPTEKFVENLLKNLKEEDFSKEE